MFAQACAPSRQCFTFFWALSTKLIVRLDDYALCNNTDDIWMDIRERGRECARVWVRSAYRGEMLCWLSMKYVCFSVQVPHSPCQVWRAVSGQTRRDQTIRPGLDWTGSVYYVAKLVIRRQKWQKKVEVEVELKLEMDLAWWPAFCSCFESLISPNLDVA